MAVDLPLLEFDGDSPALIDPEPVPSRGEVPERAVVCFFRDVIDEVCGDGRADVVAETTWESGVHRLYRLPVEGGHVGVFHPGVGAPLAGGVLEEMIATGCRTFVACGGAGAVIPGLALGHVVVPDAAVRDEGTSFHYLPPGREVAADPAVTAVLSAVLTECDVPHVVGKTWTTDAPYRETQARIAARRAEGCVTVEMEAAAFFAVARHRAVTFGQYLYAGDDVGGSVWDSRRWQTSSARLDLFWLAVEAVQRL
ncbi:purine-nucleoside phosphorylase [Blastococcus sp. TF02-09]|uniref:nucleoside phosphorylase n=1 Tax=Blastococcus sp. TF02-09 TaxID=2250576 RepID=UPI000DEB95A0|nr:nucleoside phosphorylase [Blastococcus sp. TF02-9]RBY77471.1 purine-nucleoside phosphorylase [Blastococcus sp. TF02-9]